MTHHNEPYMDDGYINKKKELCIYAIIIFIIGCILAWFYSDIMIILVMIILIFIIIMVIIGGPVHLPDYL
jgi:Na+/melibiose symporter-like transporter